MWKKDAKEQKDIFGAAYRCRIVSWKRIFIRSGRKPYPTGSKCPGNLSEYNYPGRDAGGTLYGDRRSIVLGTDKVASVDGEEKEPAANIVKSGDYIIGVDDKEIKNKRELLDCVKDLTGEEVILHLTRNGEKIDVKIKPICSAPKEYKLGIWVR